MTAVDKIIRKLHTGLLVSGGILFFLTSCTHDPTGIDEFDIVCFDSLVFPILQTSCGMSGCHGNGSNEGDFSVSSYNSVMQLVAPGDPRGSKLYQIITDIYSEEMMPPDQPLTIQQRSIIEVWIAQGAPESICSSGIDTTGVCFVQDILPMILSNCGTTGCHDAITHEEDYVLTDYNGIMDGVVPFNPGSSKIYEVVTDNGEDIMPPSPRSPLTSTQISMLREWILNGAENSDCPSAACDTINPISFTTKVNPMLQQKCVGCHNATTASGGVNLNGYPNVQPYATTLRNGTPVLTGVVKKLASFQPMPPSYNLDECTIRTLELWIEQGAANN